MSMFVRTLEFHPLSWLAAEDSYLGFVSFIH